MGDIKLPKVNEQRQLSQSLQFELKNAIHQSIRKIERVNNYEFEVFEVDWVLLDMIKSHHTMYLNMKFNKEEPNHDTSTDKG